MNLGDTGIILLRLPLAKREAVRKAGADCLCANGRDFDGVPEGTGSDDFLLVPMTEVGRGIDDGGFGSLTIRGTGVRFTGVSLNLEVARRKLVLGVTGVFAYGDGS